MEFNNLLFSVNGTRGCRVIISRFVTKNKNIIKNNYFQSRSIIFSSNMINSKNWLCIIVYSLFLMLLFLNRTVSGSCLFNGIEYDNNTYWQDDCNNCSCINQVPYCQQIQCKYEPCQNGKILILNNDDCCPTCQEPKNACKYEEHLIQHNTEFSPKLCTTCKCKNGLIECINNCNELEYDYDSSHSQNNVQITNLSQRKSRLKQHHHNHKSRHNRFDANDKSSRNDNTFNDNNSNEDDSKVKSACIYDNNIYKFNTTWSPIKCSICKCSFNSIVDCFTYDCPNLKNCTNGYEISEDSCCPKCKSSYNCFDKDKAYKNGDFWTKDNDPCTHCSCINNQISCVKQNCTLESCKKNEVIVTKSNKCCPECESQSTDNCEYYGKMYYNGEMWYTKGCQHCACKFGKVVCMNVQCESSFCLNDEIMVKRKDECCLSCRKPNNCKINKDLEIKENNYWVPDNGSFLQQYNIQNESSTCKICQCVNGELICYSNSCNQTKYPSYVHLHIYNKNEKKELNARTIPFFANIIKSMKKKSKIFVTSGPIYSSLYINDKIIKSFTVQDLASSKVYYKPAVTSQEYSRNDYVVLSFLSAQTFQVHNILILFEYVDLNYSKYDDDDGDNYKKLLLAAAYKNENDRNIRGFDSSKDVLNARNSPRKTIYIQPGESIKLTSAELKPKYLDSNVNPDKLIYFLVSGNPKFGELKLKKIFSNDETTPAGWNQVNDIYLEKSVREFTQNDLDNGNVWYEPLNEISSSKTSTTNDLIPCKNKSSDCFESSGSTTDYLSSSSSFSSFYNQQDSQKNNGKYDHLMFEVYDQNNLDSLISKEILHFSIQKQVINETILGLEVIENQITPLTFSNFDIAGIDSSREYLIYRIIKNLEKSQGLLEHSNNPGVPIETFSQNDLNKGLILYSSPKEIGVSSQEFLFTFIVTNDNRSDTFPETPFHIKVLPSNDQAPLFKEPASNLVILQSGSLILSRDLFDVSDPDTSINNIIFTIEKPPDNAVIELRTRGQRYVISKDDSFTIQEIRDGTFRLIHNGANIDKDNLKISVSDNKHLAYKTIYLQVQLVDKIAPIADKKSTLLLSINEGEKNTIRRENLAFTDDKSSSDQILYKLIQPKNQNNNKYFGKLFNKDNLLIPPMQFTQADIDLQNIRYEAPHEIGSTTLTETVYFDVYDKEGNVLENQIFTVKIEPIDNQAPIVELAQSNYKILEGGYLVLNESLIQVLDIDSAKEQLNIVIDSQPNFGYLENMQKGTRVNSFPYTDLINGLTIRYVQSDHKNKEPNADSFIFHVTDGINESSNNKFNIEILPVNDETPIAMFENLLIENNQANKRVLITNSTLFISDFDSKPEELVLNVEDFPKNGKLYYRNEEIQSKNYKFFYSDVINKLISFRLDNKYANEDEIKFRISDDSYSFISTLKIKRIFASDKMNGFTLAPIVIERNEGLNVIAGNSYQISQEILKFMKKYRKYSNFFPFNSTLMYDYEYEGSGNEKYVYENFLYKIINLPKFGKLQYRIRKFSKDLTQLNKFTQMDINEGRIYYYHDQNDPTGITSIRFNVTDSESNVLANQRFIISVRGDKIPPVFLINNGLRVNQTQSATLTRFDLDVKDDDSNLKNIKFHIVTQPKYGRMENVKEPGKRISSFSYEHLIHNVIRYVHEDFKSTKDEMIDLKASDGRNEAITNFFIKIQRIDNQMPILRSTFSMRVKELNRKQITVNELKVTDKDTPNDLIKILITNPPEYGTLEKLVNQIDDSLDKKISKKIEDKIISLNTNTNQKLNFILKFGNFTKSLNREKFGQYVIINEFTMADLEAGIIYYNHRSPGIKQDRFGFVVYDGYNNMFKLEPTGSQVSTSQIFTINIESDKNQAPVIEKNLGFDYLNQVDGFIGRLIMRNELLVSDKDDSDSDIVFEVIKSPMFGFLEHKDFPNKSLKKFTQQDINQNKIIFLLKQINDNVNEDNFEFDVYDQGGKNVLKNNFFHIKWSVISFEENEVTVMESEGKARVHIKKFGNTKQFGMVNCRTLSDTAKSNKDAKLYDFIHTQIRVEFNEDENYKACDVIINKDQISEPIESFYVVLEDPKYSIIGSRNKIKVSILDKKKESIIEFEKVKYEVQESDKFISLAIVRKGDLDNELQVECLTFDDVATQGFDFVSRNSKSKNHLVKIPSGETYGFCDIEIIDDDIHEQFAESFKAVLRNPSSGARIGSKFEANIFINGPNDIPFYNCKTEKLTVSENIGRVTIEITRESFDTSSAFEVLYSTIEANENELNSFSNSLNNRSSISKKNISKALVHQDYEPINQIVRFESGEITKKIYVNILNDDSYPIMEGVKMFTIRLKPVLTDKSIILNQNECSYIDPDIIHVFIDDSVEESVTVGFNQTSIIVNETSKVIKVPIIRNGDLSQSFSLICFTKQLTAIEDKDYVSRSPLEHSRLYFEPGDRVKVCPIEIINDSIFEANEEFQIRLSDLRSNKNDAEFIKFNQFTSLTVTILNEEDASVVSFSDEVYYTEEPTSSDSSVLKSITIIRTGDLSRLTSVRVSTVDDTAVSGIDYKPKTEIIKFNPGVSALDFDIEILYDNLNEMTELFKVVLGPQDPVSGIFGKIKTAAVIIRDSSNAITTNNLDLNLNSYLSLSINQQLTHINKLFSQPYLNSLTFLVKDPPLAKNNHQNLREVNMTYASSREPLICIHACHPNHPNFTSNENLCQKLKHIIDLNIKLLYTWEISLPNDYGFYSSFTKLNENSQFSFVNESILEPFYFQPFYHVRCVIQIQLQTSKNNQKNSNEDFKNNLPTYKSNFVEITDKNEKLNQPFIGTQKCSNLDLEANQNINDTNSGIYYFYRKSKTPYMPSFKFDKPFTARAEYISADFLTANPTVDAKYLNFIGLTIDVPFINGMIPLVSTMPLQNYKHLLTDPNYLNNHICSNFIGLKNEKLGVKYGFIKNNFANKSNNTFNIYDDINQKYRNRKTLELYSNLDIDRCSWKFTAFYAISELTSLCQAQIISDPDIRDFEVDKSYLTIKIPLYVSYVYASPQASWSSIEYKSYIDATIIYRTSSVLNENRIIETDFRIDTFDESNISNENRLEFGNKNRKINLNKIINTDKNQYLSSLTVSKMSLSSDGKFILEFSTVPSFYGQFVKHHPMLPNYESYIIGPSDQNSEFNLELVWSQYTFEYPEQTWKAISASYLNDYSGNYTIKLIPCYAKTSQSFKYPFDCEPREPINFSIPIIIEQAFRPVALKYSLGTKFMLSNNLLETLNPLNQNNLFDGNFRKNDQFYGTIIWNEDQDKKTSYKIEIEKVYICASTPDYILSYDPDGSIYNKGPQFGCSKAHKSLKHRILLLDRQYEPRSAFYPSNISTYSINNKRIKIDAEFLTDYLLNHTQTENSNNNDRSSKSGKLVMDGFKFNINSLFDIENYSKKTSIGLLNAANNEKITQEKENIWYVQVMFLIRPSTNKDTKKTRYSRQISNIFGLNNIYNNGTNMQTFRLINQHNIKSYNLFNDLYTNGNKLNDKDKFISMNAKLKHKNRLSESQYRKINNSKFNLKQDDDGFFFKLVVPIAVFVVLLTIAVGSVAYLKKKSIVEFLAKSGKFSKKKDESQTEKSSTIKRNNESDSLSLSETQTTIMVNESNFVDHSLNRLKNLFRNKWINTSQSKIQIYKPRLLKRKPNKHKLKKHITSQSNENYSGTNSTSDTIVVNSPFLANNNLNGTEIIIHHETSQTNKDQANNQAKRCSILNIDYKKVVLTEEDMYNSLENEASNLDKILTSLNNELNDYSINLNRQEQATSNYFKFPEIQQPITSTHLIEQPNLNNIDYDENIYRIDPNIENINSIHDDLKSMDKDIFKKNHDSTKKLNTFKMILQKMSNNGSPSKSSKSTLVKQNKQHVDMSQYEDDLNYFEEDSTASNRTVRYNNTTTTTTPMPNDIVTCKPPISSCSSSTITNHNRKLINKSRNNYLYFNYNNNKMHYYNTETGGDSSQVIDNEILMNDSVINSTHITSYTPLLPDVMAISMHSSTPNQATPVSSTTKCSINNVQKIKRLSGTEV